MNKNYNLVQFMEEKGYNVISIARKNLVNVEDPDITWAIKMVEQLSEYDLKYINKNIFKMTAEDYNHDEVINSCIDRLVYQCNAYIQEEQDEKYVNDYYNSLENKKKNQAKKESRHNTIFIVISMILILSLMTAIMCYVYTNVMGGLM